MGKRDLEKERQMELAAIWGSEVDGESRFPRRRRAAAKRTVLPDNIRVDGVDDVLSDIGSDISDGRVDDKQNQKKKKKKDTKKASGGYRLHCFVGPGTDRNMVRTVFEDYEPNVEIRTAQKGNLLNKTQFAVLTFRNKAMGLHAVKTLDGTNQRDLLGVRELKLSLMLSRKAHNAACKKMRRSAREERERKAVEETEEDAEFIRNFIEHHTHPTKKV